MSGPQNLLSRSLGQCSLLARYIVITGPLKHWYPCRSILSKQSSGFLLELLNKTWVAQPLICKQLFFLSTALSHLFHDCCYISTKTLEDKSIFPPWTPPLSTNSRGRIVTAHPRDESPEQLLCLATSAPRHLLAAQPHRSLGVLLATLLRSGLGQHLSMLPAEESRMLLLGKNNPKMLWEASQMTRVNLVISDTDPHLKSLTGY